MKRMGDFFGGLLSGNIKQPDSQWNVGPLPNPSNGPAGSSGDPDGRINGTSELLSNITPYAYANSARTGSDRNYQQIPHRVQKIVPCLYLPPADIHEDNLVPLSHAVDQGDIAFVVNTSRVQNITYSNQQQLDGAIANVRLPSRDALVNLCTVNYLLAGLQRLDFDVSLAQQHKNAWFRLAKDIGFHNPHVDSKTQILNVFRNAFIPFGICAGSEKQGGLHETGLAPVQAAVNHVTTLTIDGQNRDLVNLWRNTNISAGDQLIFRLEYLPTRTFTLNHYYKGTVHQNFSSVKNCWQIVPDIFRMAYDNTRFNCMQRLPSPFQYDYRVDGYWRIAQCFQHRNMEKTDVQNYSNDMMFLRGQLLQVTFAPVWTQMDHYYQKSVTHTLGSQSGLITSSKKVHLSKPQSMMLHTSSGMDALRKRKMPDSIKLVDLSSGVSQPTHTSTDAILTENTDVLQTKLMSLLPTNAPVSTHTQKVAKIRIKKVSTTD